MCWVVTANTALVATAASAALPPARSAATPASAAVSYTHLDVYKRQVQGLRWRTVGRLAAGVGLAATASYLAGVVINLDRPAPVSKAAVLASWLEEHDLHDGVGDYWSASIVTVESSGSVEVRPVFSPDDRRLVGYNRNSSTDWYKESFRFVVFRLGTTRCV